MKYVNQKDYPHWLYITRIEMDEENQQKGKTSTVASSACGLCSAVMVADRLLVDSKFELADAIELSYSVKANCNVGTNYRRFAPAFAEKLGLDWESTNDTARVVYCLQTGGVVVVHVGGKREGFPGLFSRSGHYVVAISQERDGRIAILDPAYRPGRYDIEGCEGYVTMKNEVIALCDLDILAKDASNRDPSFYLFWRK